MAERVIKQGLSAIFIRVLRGEMESLIQTRSVFQSRQQFGRRMKLRDMSDVVLYRLSGGQTFIVFP